MALTEVINLELNTNSNDVQQQFSQLRNSIKSTSDEIENLTKDFGENSDEVKQATQQLNSLQDAYNDLSKSATDLNAKFDEVYGDMQPLTARMGEAEDRLYELSLAGKTATQEYADLLAEVGRYRKAQMETDMVVDAASTTMNQKLGGALQGVASGFSVGQGVMATFGSEAESLEPMLIKLQGAMAISEGINGLREGSKSIKQLGRDAKATFAQMSASGKAFAVTGIGLLVAGIGLVIANYDKLKSSLSKQTATQKVANEVTAQATDSIKMELSAADKLSRTLQDETLSRAQKIQKVKEFQAAYPGLLKNINLETQSINQINGQLTKNIKLLQLQAQVKAIEAVRADKLQEKLKEQLDIQKEAQDHAGEWTLNLGSSANNGWIGYSTGAENAKLATMNFTKIQTDGTKTIDKQINALDASSKEIEKQIKLLESQGASVDTGTDKIVDFSKQTQSFTNSTNDSTDAIDKQNKINERKAEILKDIQDAQREYSDSQLTEQEREILAVQRKYATLLSEAKEYNSLLTEAEKDKAIDMNQITIAQMNEENDINLKYQEIAYESEQEYRDKIAAIRKENSIRMMTEQEAELLEVAEKYKELEALAKDDAKSLQEIEIAKMNEINDIQLKYQEMEYEAAEEQAKKLEELNKKKLEDDKKAQKEKVDLILNYAQTFASALSSLNNLMNVSDQERLKNAEGNAEEEERIKKKMFERDKKLRIVQTIVDTASNVINSVRNNGGVPAGIPFGIAAGAMGAMQIAAISKTKFEGGGSSTPSGADGGGLSGGAIAPSFNVVGNSGINQLAQLQQQPMQAYVVSGEVTSAQSLDRNRIKSATW